MAQNNLEKFKSLAINAKKTLGYEKATLSFLKDSNENPLEYFCSVKLYSPKDESKSPVFANFVLTSHGIKVVHYFMIKYNLFIAADEEKSLYPEDYSIYQDDELSYITTLLKDDLTTVFTEDSTLENIFLSEKTCARYEKISDYVDNYKNLRLAIEECVQQKKDEEIITYLKNNYTFKKQIIEPLAKACSYVLNLNPENSKIAIKPVSEGSFVIMSCNNPEENSQTGICLLISEKQNEVFISKITSKDENGNYVTIEIPDDVLSFTKIMQKKVMA